MRRTKVPSHFGPLFLSTLLAASIAFAPGLHAQAPAAGTAVSVRMLDTVNSASDPVGKQYRASVTKAIDAGNGVSIAQGAAATVTLTSSGSGYTAQLSSITLNGQQVAVSSNSASVSALAQSATNKAASAVGSVLGGFGHHVNAPASVAAAATGQHVFVPTGATLSFVLGQPPATASAAPSAVATSGEPTPQPAATSGPKTPVFYCLAALPAQNTIYYSPIEQAGHASTQGETENAFAAFLQKTYGIRVSTACTQIAAPTTQVSDRQNKIDDYRRSYKVVETSWVYAPAGGPIAPAAPVAIWTGKGAPFISCSTSTGGGIDSYITGVFQTKHPVRHLPNGGNLVDQGVLDRFYAYLTQKGYHFKPGSNYACAVEPTEAQAKAAQHTRYESGGCSNCGKVVETGWTDTQ